MASYYKYILEAKGKKLRSKITLLASGLFGNITKEHTKLCTIIELIHIATLVHDDVLDEAKIRRNKKTVNQKWGNHSAVLLGDSIFIQAFKLALEFKSDFIINEILNTARNVCNGEILQSLNKFDDTISKEQYYKIIKLKTADLFAYSAKLGAHLAGANPKEQEKIFKIGEEIGIAYQIYDDCVDIVGDEESIGKTLGTDFTKGKLTLPMILLIKNKIKTNNKFFKLNLKNILKDSDKLYKTLHSSIEIAISHLDNAHNLLIEFNENSYQTEFLYFIENLRFRINKQSSRI